MSEEETTGWGFAAPPFKAAEALARLQRKLRALGLAERAGVFERRGAAIARAALVEGALQVALVQRPSRLSPQWVSRTLKDAAQQRDFEAELERKLGQWSDLDD